MNLHSISKRLLFVTISCLFIFCGRENLCAQNNLRFQAFTSENGLSENVIYSIFQDSKGYLWVGTDNGLNRFDGYAFKKFWYDPSNRNSLPSNRINDICEDQHENIWFATGGGVCKFNYQDGRMSRLDSKDSAVDVKQVISLGNDELLFVAMNQINVLNTRNNTKVEVGYWFDEQLHFHGTNHTPLSRDHKGNIYLAETNFQDCIWQYDPVHQYFTKLINLTSVSIPANSEIGNFYKDSHDHWWIAKMLHGKKEILSGTLTSNNSMSILEEREVSSFVYHIIEDNTGNIWFGSLAGVIFYDYASNHFVRYQHSSSTNSLSSDIINAIYEDKTGNIWFGTFAGLDRVNVSQQRFSHFVSDPENSRGLPYNFILGIYADTSNIVNVQYLFGSNFFSRLDIAHQTVENYPIDRCDVASYVRNAVVRDPARLTDSTLKRLIHLVNQHSRGFLPPSSVYFGPQDRIWRRMENIFTDLKTGREHDFNFYITDAGFYNDEVWLSTTGGGLLFFKGDFTVGARYLNKSTDSSSINSNDITCFIIEKNGDIWVGSKGGGLNFFNRQKKNFEHFTESNGLCNNSIYDMVQDNKGRIWIGTSNGLSCFDTATHLFRNYFRSDGLVNSEYNRYSACKLNDGTILMGGISGIDYFHPDSLINDNYKPQVQITDFKIFNKSTSPYATISLPHNQNAITIEFAAMDFRNPSGNKFMYQLQGVDRGWTSLENRNFVAYSVLSPGHYRFLLKGANSDGVWNEKPVELDFTIRTPWWRTWWFYTLCFILVGMLLFSLYRFRIKQLRKLMALRTKISQDLHDEVGATLSGIAMYSHLIRRQLKGKENEDVDVDIEHSLNVIQQSAGDMVNKLSDIVWIVNPQNDSLKKLLHKLEEYASEMAKTQNLKVNASFPEKIAEVRLPMEARRNIYLICKEAINNAVKYSDGSLLELSVKAFDHSLEFLVADNGKGFDAEKIKKGNGLENMTQRAEEIGADLKLASSDQRGTELRLVYKIPQ